MKNLFVCFLLVVLLSVSNLFSQYYSEVKILASDGLAGDKYGLSVSMDGTHAIVGSPYAHNGSEINFGAAYVYYQHEGGISHWGHVKKLIASDKESFDYFGYSVGYYNGLVVVGAYGDDDKGDGSGSAYIFNMHHGGDYTWGEMKKLTASDGSVDDGFGSSVSAGSQTCVIVGSPCDDDFGESSGSAYIYFRNQGGTDNWGEVKKLIPSDGSEFGVFGDAVSMYGRHAVVGAWGNEDKGWRTGAAYIFDIHQGGASNWGQVKKLSASDASYGDYFGTSVAISKDFAVIGAYGSGNGGAAYIFDCNEDWGQVKKLIASDGEHNDLFGSSVAIYNDYIIVGSPQDDDNGNASGSSYLYYRHEGGTDNWGEIKKLITSDGAAYDKFGMAVSITSGNIIAGAWADDDNGNASGSAYTYDFNYIPTTIDDNPFKEELPVNFRLYQNYPNPFNPTTTISYTLPKSAKVTVDVFNSLGQKVSTLLNSQMPSGQHQVNFNAENLPSGVYFFRLQAGEFQAVKKMILLK